MRTCAVLARPFTFGFVTMTFLAVPGLAQQGIQTFLGDSADDRLGVSTDDARPAL